MTVDIEKLLPCPFCGGAPRYLARQEGFYVESVICDTCMFLLKPNVWNRRAAPAAGTVEKDAFPADHQVVPLKPTIEMIHAGMGYFNGMREPATRAGELYSCMLRASPKVRY